MKQPRGPFTVGDQVQLTDPKGRQHRLILTAGRTFHTHRGGVAHDDLIGQPEGSLVTSTGGTPYIALRPLLSDYTLSMARGAAVVYPKDAAQILAAADIFPGATVVEAGPAPARCRAGCCARSARKGCCCRMNGGRTLPRLPAPMWRTISAARTRPGG